MGYLHFDRVKIPQENLIFNDSSSIQLSSVNRLLKEHGIVLKNDEEQDTTGTKPKNTVDFDDFLKNIISINKDVSRLPEHSADSEILFSTSTAHESHISSLSVDALQKSPNGERAVGCEQLSLSLDEELAWKLGSVNDDKAFFSKPSSVCAKTSADNCISNNNDDSGAKTSTTKKDLLDLKQYGAICQVPGFKKLQEKYKCSIHKISKRGRGRKLKCCQTADDLFKVALKQQCDSLGVQDYSKYKRRRGRPRKAASTALFGVNTVSSSKENNNVSTQKNDFVAAGSVIDQCNNSNTDISTETNNLSVQFQLNQLQKQLEDQQNRLNEQIISMNKQQSPLSGLMALLQQPPNINNRYLIQSHSASIPHQLDQLKNSPMNFLNTENNNNMLVSEVNLTNKESYYSPSTARSTLDHNNGISSHLENILSPLSLNTPGCVSPDRYNDRETIPTLNAILANDLLNPSRQFERLDHSKSPSNAIMNRENNRSKLDRGDITTAQAVYRDDEHFVKMETPSNFYPAYTSDATNVSSQDIKGLLFKEEATTENKKKIQPAEKHLHHISGKTIEVDPQTQKLKCLFEGCTSQFKQKAYLSRHMKKHSPIKDYVCPFWSSNHCSENSRKSSIHSKSGFEKSLAQRDLLKSVSEKAMNRYISTLQCHSKGYFTRKDEFIMHLKSFHIASEFKEMADYACCVECGEEFSSMKECYDSHILTLKCPMIVNKEFNKGRELRRKYEKGIRQNKSME